MVIKKKLEIAIIYSQFQTNNSTQFNIFIKSWQILFNYLINLRTDARFWLKLNNRGKEAKFLYFSLL